MTSKLGVLGLMVLLASSAAEARARSRSSGFLESQNRPIATFRGTLFSGIPDLFGASVTVTMLRPVELEVGISTALVISSLYARAGVAPSLVDARDSDGVGFTLTLPMLAGYRYLEVASLTGPAERLSGVNVVAGLEGVFWLAPHFGLNLQALAGGSYWLDGFSEGRGRLFPDLRLAVGIAF
jgi:hypothetical protein